MIEVPKAGEPPIVFSKNDCTQCEASKADLKARGVEFREINISLEPQYVPDLKGLGFKSAPVIVTSDGSWSGHKPERIAEVFGE